MTKEQEAIEYLKESVLIYKNTIPKISESIETVLSMLKEKDKEIERLEKVLEERYRYIVGARTVHGRLMKLDKEDIVRDDLSLRNEIHQHIKEKEEKDKEIEKALDIAFQYGQIDGGHHKAWVIDQMVRTLTGDKYKEWVKEYTYDEETGECYSWYKGIAP